jgi:hypothetical protein
MKSKNFVLRAVLEQNPVRKILSGRPKLRWEGIVKRNVEELGVNFKDLAINRNGRKINYEKMVWSIILFKKKP